MGGLSRRATVLQKRRDAGPTVVVDAGDLFWKAARLPESRTAQQRVKAILQLDAYALMGMDAMVPGEADLSLGVDWLSRAATERNLPYVAANLSCDGWEIPPHRVIERAGLRIALIGVVGMSNAGPCSARSTVPAVKQSVIDTADADLHILISHQDALQDDSISRSVPELDVIVNGHGRKLLQMPNQLEGGAIQLGAGTRGKKLGIAELGLVPSGSGFAILGLTDRLVDQLQRALDRRERTAQRVDKARTDETRKRAQSVLDRIDRQV